MPSQVEVICQSMYLQRQRLQNWTAIVTAYKLSSFYSYVKFGTSGIKSFTLSQQNNTDL